MAIAPSHSQHPIKVKHPKKHNHYGFREFFQFDPDRGTILDWNDSQTLLTTEDFIIGLVEGLDEEVGEATATVMYTIGHEWGQKDALFFERWFEKEFDRNIRQANLLFLLETWWWPFASQGWGRWELDMGDRRHGFMFINIFDSVVARTLGDIGKPVCYLYAGLFSGFFTELVRQPLSCIEIQCYAMSETYCKFLLGGAARIDAATFWMNEGAHARDIEKRLRARELLK